MFINSPEEVKKRKDIKPIRREVWGRAIIVSYRLKLLVAIVANTLSSYHLIKIKHFRRKKLLDILLDINESK